MQTFYRGQHRDTGDGPYHHINPMLSHEVMKDYERRIGMLEILSRARASFRDYKSFRCGFKSIKDLRRWFPPEVLLPLVREYGFEIVKVRGALVAKSTRGYNSVVFRPAGTEMQTNPKREKMNWHAGLLHESGLKSCCRYCCCLCRGGRGWKAKNSKDNTLRTHRTGR